jgi:nitroreductase
MNETLNTIFTSRTIHGNFTGQEISEQDMQTILSAAVRAPNASNRQAYSIVVIDDRAVMKEICGYQGSRALLFCVDYNRIIDLAEHTGHPYTPDGLVAFVTGSVDATLAAQTAALAAKSLGIDSLFTNGIHRVAIDSVYKKLGLPEKYCFPLILLVLGYPTAEPGYLKGRITSSGVVHRNQYHRLSHEELDEMVDTYDNPANHLVLNPAWKSEDCAHYLDWFFTKWSGPGFNPKEIEFAEILGRAGFVAGKLTLQEN